MIMLLFLFIVFCNNIINNIEFGFFKIYNVLYYCYFVFLYGFDIFNDIDFFFDFVVFG